MYDAEMNFMCRFWSHPQDTHHAYANIPKSEIIQNPTLLVPNI